MDQSIGNNNITPPPELVQQWRKSGPADAAVNNAYECHIATRAAQWGADMELEALLVWLRVKGFDNLASDLLAARRPKPPSLKEQALEALDQADKGLNKSEWQQCSDTIRRALDALPE
jgi:hypothetical protein